MKPKQWKGLKKD